MRKITCTPLNKKNFEAFGDFITLDGAESFKINGGSTDRFHALSKIDTSTDGGVPIISVFRGQAFHLPFQLKVMERHPLGSQSFIPLNPHAGQRYLIVVAPASCSNEAEIMQHLTAFVAKGFEGVTYGKGVWHHPLISLDKENDFLVIDRLGTGNNCDEITLTESVIVEQ